MSNSPDEKDLDATKAIMAKLAAMPHKPHDENKIATDAKKEPAKPRAPKKR